MVTALSDPKCVMHRTNVGLGAKSQCFQNAFLQPSVTTSKETVSSFTESAMAGHTVPKATEDMVGTVVGSESDATDYKLQLPSRYVVKLPLGTRIEVEQALADFSVVTKTNVEVIFENRLTKWTKTLQ